MSRFGRQFSVLSLDEEGQGASQCFPLHQRPAQEDRPNRFDACPPGPRGFRWLVKVPTKPHSLVFIVADGDNGDPRCKAVSHRDTAMLLDEEGTTPWDLQRASVLFRSEMRMHSRIRFTVYEDILWSEWRFKDKSHRVWLRPRGVHSPTQAASAVDDDFALARNGTTEVSRTMSMADQGDHQVELNRDNGCLLLHSGKYDDAYTSMGTFETVRGGPFNRVVLQQVRDGSLVLFGDGASDAGLRPFVDSVRIQLDTGRNEVGGDSQLVPPRRGDYLEQPIRLLGDDGQRLLLARESIAQPRERFLRNMLSGEEQSVTVNKDPKAKQAALFDNLAEKKVLHYKREDGVDLTATLYLPKKAATEGRPPPCIVWAYPESYSSGKSAGQVRVSKYQFKRATWARPLMWISKGFLTGEVLDNPSMPIIGDGDTANDTFIQQLVMNGEAAVYRLVLPLSSAQVLRVAVGGHSYGAFMTAHLLAHTRPGLFRAGIGRSGAYNRSLTPFGFQREERNYWDATEVYHTMSPFTWADRIAANKWAPLLLIHGQNDANSGTAPLQSERLFGAIKGLGGVARLCMLPKEGHHYKTIEGVMQATWEMDQWLTRYVLVAEPLPSEETEATSRAVVEQSKL
ncbi:dipeptidyl-peptidase, putative [Perkinsus marinus ATCC 50983]|uniref:Dipeptidyl-peptidase, putative n=1 Tax=Perkinsus marinus (strain ATCC 50983 / TXsc) TaxID=423536 RepID=C5KBE3_PERM5|nr:dipeptidyl-peptidase, putative [Perkinsus marinus ATCC 50983]EER18469.1 dipeptidyl-peptidase, putative [Perkinsus marinus ATCC 50983]|eukprot:XP_002786673.1 dipeptidyl-peptidase, putative [Perkinsus marinus ATCC 50983]